MADANPDPLSRLIKILGFHPTKETPIADPVVGGVFAQALRKVKQQKEAQALEVAVKLLESALTCQSRFEEIRRQFASEERRYLKELGKVVQKIEALAHGETLTASEATTTEDKANGEQES